MVSEKCSACILPVITMASMGRLNNSKSFWCAVEGCSSDDRKRGKYAFMEEVSFFSFPTEKKAPRLRKKWIQMIRRDCFEPKRNHRVCSLHFIDGQPTSQHPCPELFQYNNFGKVEKKYSESIRKLEKFRSSSTSIGTKSPPRSPTSPRQSNSKPTQASDSELHITTTRSSTATNTSGKQGFEPVFHLPISMEVEVQTTMNCNEENRSQSDVHFHKEHSYTVDKRAEVPDSVDRSCQTLLTGQDLEIMEMRLARTKEQQMRENFVDIVTKNDENVKKYTGIPTKSQLVGLFDVLHEAEPNLKYWCGKSTAGEVKYQTSSSLKTGPNRKLSKFHEYLLTLIKLRLAVMSFFLGDIFSVSESRVSQIFTTWINLMFTTLTPCIKWPSRKKIKKHMPNSFQRDFPNTTTIIDCTEVYIQKPRTPTAQNKTYSSYKSHNTFKVLVSITPSGAFSFISNLWGGNTSDRYITEHSGFLDMLSPGDEVMADRGFAIRDLVTERKATLVIPPFTRKCSWGKGKRLTAHEVIRTRKIAKLRIHVERAIQKLKNFHMLSGLMSLKYKPLS